MTDPAQMKARIKLLEDVINDLMTHKDSLELIAAFDRARVIMGREEFYKVV